MTTALAARPSNSPLPMGATDKKVGGPGGGIAWPATEGWILPGTGQNGDTFTFYRPERFWLRVGACCIAYNPSGNWARYDYQLRLVVNESNGPDLNGINFFQKANALGGGTTWWGTSIEALFFCEANTDYLVGFLSKGGSGLGSQYFQASVHWNLWAYTIGEGVY